MHACTHLGHAQYNSTELDFEGPMCIGAAIGIQDISKRIHTYLRPAYRDNVCALKWQSEHEQKRKKGKEEERRNYKSDMSLSWWYSPTARQFRTFCTLAY